MSLLPSKIEFELPDWSRAQEKKRERLAEDFLSLSTKAGFSDKKTMDKVAMLRRAAPKGIDNLVLLLRSPADIRAYAHFLASPGLPDTPVFSKAVAREISRFRPRLTTLLVRELIRAFLTNFESIRSENDSLLFHRYLSEELSGLEDSLSDGELKKLARVAQKLFVPKGPKLLSEAAIKREADLEELLVQLGFGSYRDTAYVAITRSQYVVQKIAALPVGEDAPILHELKRREFSEAYAGRGQLVGHLALEVLIDRTVGNPSEAWLAAVLSIAGDPRVSRSSPRFSQWWAKLGEKRISTVRRWLSVLDVKLFLDVIHDYGKSQNDRELMRMYPDRKRFLQGLVSQGLVRDTRLFLSKSADRYVRRTFEPSELPSFATVADPMNRSMIYMQLDKAIIIEGSHNRTLYIMPKLPKETRVLSYGVTQFGERELGKGLASQYQTERPKQAHRLYSITHNGHWHNKAIQALRKLGVRFEVEPLLSEKAYADFRREHRV